MISSALSPFRVTCNHSNKMLLIQTFTIELAKHSYCYSINRCYKFGSQYSCIYTGVQIISPNNTGILI